MENQLDGRLIIVGPVQNNENGQCVVPIEQIMCYWLITWNFPELLSPFRFPRTRVNSCTKVLVYLPNRVLALCNRCTFCVNRVFLRSRSVTSHLDRCSQFFKNIFQILHRCNDWVAVHRYTSRHLFHQPFPNYYRRLSKSWAWGPSCLKVEIQKPPSSWNFTVDKFCVFWLTNSVIGHFECAYNNQVLQ